MTTETPIVRGCRLPGRLLVVFGALLLLGGCTTYSTRYYADDAGYGYYDPEPAYDTRTSVYLGVGYGYADPWVYPYWSLDLFYFGPYGYTPWHPVYSSWAYVPLRYRFPYSHRYGYGYGFGYGPWGWFGHGYASWTWPYYGYGGHGYYGYHHPYGYVRHHDRDHQRAVDPRTRRLAVEQTSTPTRRALLGGARASTVPPRPTLDPARTRADVLTNAPSRAALRGQLGESSAAQRRAQSAARTTTSAPPRSSLSSSNGPPSRSFDRASEATSSRRTLLTPPQSTRAVPGRGERFDNPSTASASNRSRTVPPTIRPTERSRMLRQTTPRSERPPRFEPPARTPARESTLRRAAPPPTTRSAPAPQQRAPVPASRPALVPDAPRTAPPPRATPPPASAPPRWSSGSDRRRDSLSGRPRDSRRD